MRVLVTRPIEQAEATAEALSARGHEPLVEPLLTVRYLPGLVVEPGDAAALVLTSVNAVAALDSRLRHLPVACVGAATATAARARGFDTIGGAPGSVAALAQAIGGLLPRGSTVLHLAGEQLAAGTADAFTAAGLDYRALTVYRAAPARALSAATRIAFAGGTVDAVLLFSPRTARICCRLIAAAGLAEAVAEVRAACLSPAVAAAAAALPWRDRPVAAARDQTALLDCLDDRK